MPIQIESDEFKSEYGANKFNDIVKTNQVKKWFFNIGIGATYSATGTFFEARESVKKYFKNSNQASYGIIKLVNIEDV